MMRTPLVGLFCLMLFLSSCARDPSKFYFGDYSEAERHFDAGHYEKAIQKYQSYIDGNPEGHLAVISKYHIAKSHMELGHRKEAQQLFQQIIDMHQNLVWANFSETRLKEMNANSSS